MGIVFEQRYEEIRENIKEFIYRIEIIGILKNKRVFKKYESKIMSF